MRELDVLASICKYITDAYHGIPIESARNVEEISVGTDGKSRDSKYFGVGLVRRKSMNLGLRAYIESDRWIIIYLGENENNVRDIIDTLRTDFIDDKKIIGYLHDYKFPVPRLVQLDSLKNMSTPITIGEYTLGFTGIRTYENEDQESKLSEEVRVNITEATRYLTIQFPKIPPSVTVFNKYNIYVKDGNDWQRVKQVTQDRLGTNLRIDVHSLLPEIPSVLYNNNELSLVVYKNIQVIETYSEIFENTKEDGFWRGIVLLDLQSPGMLRDKNSWLIRKITVNHEVGVLDA